MGWGNDIIIHDDHGSKGTAMTPKELLKHLKDDGDSSHTAISIHFEKLNSKSIIHLTPGGKSFPVSSPFFFIFLCLHEKF
jgi:hypothetical protein